jgi:glutamate dehydrogenase (NAD(P)+)
MKNSVFNPFVTAQSQFDRTAEWLGLDQPTRELLRMPLKEFRVLIPLRMDDGTVKVLQGYRVIHNDARGPAKGGIRFHPSDHRYHPRAGRVDDLECALMDIPLGGSSVAAIARFPRAGTAKREG